MLVNITNENITNGTVVVDFYATWCNPCKMLAPVFEQVSNEVEGVTFGKVNIDENMELTVKYNVTTVPTIVLLKDGVEVDRIVGFVPKEKLISMVTK